MPKLKDFTVEQIIHWRLMRDAVRKGSLPTIQFLIEDFPDYVNRESNLINAVDNYGNSLGHVAAENPTWSVFDVLGFYGADFRIKNLDNKTPADILEKARGYNVEKYNIESALNAIEKRIEKYYRPTYFIELDETRKELWIRAVECIKRNDEGGLRSVLADENINMDIKEFVQVVGGREGRSVWQKDLVDAAAHCGAGEGIVNALCDAGINFHVNLNSEDGSDYINAAFSSGNTETAYFMIKCAKTEITLHRDDGMIIPTKREKPVKSGHENNNNYCRPA